MHTPESFRTASQSDGLPTLGNQQVPVPHLHLDDSSLLERLVGSLQCLPALRKRRTQDRQQLHVCWFLCGMVTLATWQWPVLEQNEDGWQLVSNDSTQADGKWLL